MIATDEQQVIIDKLKAKRLSMTPPNSSLQSSIGLQSSIDKLTDTVAKLVDRIAVLEEQNAAMRPAVSYIMAIDALEQNYLPPLEHITLLEWQVFFKDDHEIKKGSGHDNWSARLNVAVEGRRLRNEPNVSLYAGYEFAAKVRETLRKNRHDVSPEIERLAEQVADQRTKDIVYGVFRRQTIGSGTPLYLRQTIILTGHLDQQPKIEIWVEDKRCVGTTFRSGSGTKKGHSLWFGQITPRHCNSTIDTVVQKTRTL